MKKLFAIACVFLVLSGNPKLWSETPVKIVTDADFRALLLSTDWTWRNVSAGVPDRECTFMADGTFHHPYFIAKFTIKNTHVVELVAKGKHALMTFDPTYTSFKAVDFEKHGITGKRIKP